MIGKLKIDFSKLEELEQRLDELLYQPRRRIKEEFTIDNLREFMERRKYYVAKCRNCGRVIIGVNSMCPLCGYVFSELIKRYDIPTPPPFGPIETEEDFVRAVEIRKKYHFTPLVIDQCFKNKPYASEERALAILRQLIEEYL